MASHDSIIPTLEHSAALLRKRFAVRSLSVFGSVARRQTEPTSDVDVLVEFEGASTFDRYMDLKFYLEDLLSRPVDLVTPNALKERMRPTVQQEAIRVA